MSFSTCPENVEFKKNPLVIILFSVSSLPFHFLVNWIIKYFHSNNKYCLFNILQVGYDQFQQVLLSSGRQEFVELFLDRGFILHKYLNSRRLELLFKLCEDRTFFAEICLEIILGEKIVCCWWYFFDILILTRGRLVSCLAQDFCLSFHICATSLISLFLFTLMFGVFSFVQSHTHISEF